MFISIQHLHENLGIDTGIATFFVDRKIPANNLYWKKRYLYITRRTGYLFIPIFFDLQLRSGLPRDMLLDEGYVRLMEDILHSAAMHEFEQIDFLEHVNNCKRLLTNKIRNKALYDDLIEYFKDEQLKPYKSLGTVSKALSRGDSFLFSLCYLELPSQLQNEIVKQWYALVPSFLLMDDLMDLKEDLDKNEENAIYDFGQGSIGVHYAIDFLRNKFKLLKQLNETLGEYFERSLEKKLQTPYFQSILNN